MSKPKKNEAQLKTIYEALGDRLEYSLKKLIEEGKPIPPALATAAAGYLKLHKVGDQIAEESAREAAENASRNFVSRIPAAELGPIDEAIREEKERAIIEENTERLGIQSVEWMEKERRMMEDR